MYLFLTVLHVVICFIMVAVILLQSGKGAEIGASFGGSSQTIFGSRGPGTFLSKMTSAMAVIFFTTSIGLSILSKGRFTSTSVIDLNEKAAPAVEVPVVPDRIPAAPATEGAPVDPPAGSGLTESLPQTGPVESP